MKAQIDKAGLSNVRLLLAGVQDQAPKILSRAINKTASKGKTESSKAIRGEVNLSAAYVRDRLKVRKASYRNLQARVQAPKRGLLLSYYLYGVTGINQDTGRATRGALLKYRKGYFSVANLDQPLKVRIKKGEPPVTLGPEWFILPKLKNSNLPALAKRVNGKLKLHGPSLSQVFSNVIDDLRGPLAEYQEEQVSKSIDSLLRGF